MTATRASADSNPPLAQQGRQSQLLTSEGSGPVVFADSFFRIQVFTRW